MGRILLSGRYAENAAVEKAACMVGSFDCLHRGHEWICAYLLERFTHVILLIPARHYEKKVRKGANASFRERLLMLETLVRQSGGRVMTGLTGEILFLRLHERLHGIFPGASVTFAMGSDTYRKLLNSKDYFARSGLPWDKEDEKLLTALKERIIVFDRTGLNSTFVTPPPCIASISSSQVRSAVREWRQSGESDEALHTKLGGMVAPEVVSIILSRELYRFSDDPVRKHC